MRWGRMTREDNDESQVRIHNGRQAYEMQVVGATSEICDWKMINDDIIIRTKST